MVSPEQVNRRWRSLFGGRRFGDRFHVLSLHDVKQRITFGLEVDQAKWWQYRYGGQTLVPGTDWVQMAVIGEFHRRYGDWFERFWVGPGDQWPAPDRMPKPA